MGLTLSIGTLNDADLWNLKRALADAQQPTIPATPSSPSSNAAYVVPPAVANRLKLVTPMPWVNGQRLLSQPLTDASVWLIPFTAGPFTIGRFQGAEWIDQPTYRSYVLLRNDGTVVVSPAPTMSPGIQFTSGDPGRFSGKVHLDVGASYTLAVWNKYTVPSGRMLMELYFS